MSLNVPTTTGREAGLGRKDRPLFNCLRLSRSVPFSGFETNPVRTAKAGEES